MIDEHLTIVVEGREVSSVVSYDDSHPDLTIVWITSTCEEHVSRNPLTIKHRPGCAPEHVEEAVSAARKHHAETVASKAEIRGFLPALIRRMEGEPRRVQAADLGRVKTPPI